jgi:hypothetical protein
MKGEGNDKEAEMRYEETTLGTVRTFPGWYDEPSLQVLMDPLLWGGPDDGLLYQHNRNGEENGMERMDEEDNARNCKGISGMVR